MIWESQFNNGKILLSNLACKTNKMDAITAQVPDKYKIIHIINVCIQ
jgi:hypothetical protein